MKKLVLALVFTLIPIVSYAADTCTWSTDGLWTTGASGGAGCVPPTNDDTCTINAGVEVLCDGAPCTCLNLTINGTLTMKTGVRSLVIGDGLNTATSGNLTIGAAGFLKGDKDSTLEIDVNRASSENLGIITNNGALDWEGQTITTGGSITSFSAISGTFGSGAGQIMTLTTNKSQTALDSYSGMVLVPRTGYFRGQWFDITTGAATLNEIVIQMNTRGAIDSRGTLGRVNPMSTVWAPGDWGSSYSTGNATVASGGTTVTFSTAFSNVDNAGEILLGSRFICTDAAGNDDLSVATVATNTRRFCSVTDTTHAELCTAYGTASCAGGSTFVVYDDNMPPYAIAPIERFSAGDTFDIIDPAVITIPSANRSDTTQTKPLHFIINSGSTTRFKNTEIGYCGQDISSTEYSCITVNQVGNSGSTEGFYVDTVDLHHYSGQYGLLLNDPDSITISWLTERDAAEGGDSDGSEGHASGLIDTSTAPEVSGIVFDHVRFVRGNDDCFSWNLSGGDTSTCDDCEIRNSVMGFNPSNVLINSSAQGFEPIGGLTNFKFHDNLVTNVNEELVRLLVSAQTDAQSGAYYHNVLQNSQNTTCFSAGSTVEGTGLTVANNKVWVTDNVIQGCRGNGIIRGHNIDNYINIGTLASSAGSAGVSSSPESRGNIIVGARQIGNALSIGFHQLPSAGNTIIGTSIAMSDNVVVGTTDPSTSATVTYALGMHGVTTVSGVTLSADHNTVICNDALNATSSVWGARPNPGTGSIFSYSNSIFYDCEAAVNETSQSGTGDSTISYNLNLKVDSNPSTTDGGNNLTAGRLGISSFYDGNANISVGSVPFTSPGSDGYVRGARVAGPPGGAKAFRTIYPFLADFPVVNNASDKDSDADGVWDLIDNCDRTFNPLQYDGDSDGKGCACDASGDTCP